ncbi:MarR family transcriptional regulator [Aeromicrobium sp. PE09-221]|uniref:GbsR/MarR family transcriptional regulator n=1 Tax=Aeromicrobium sp. PE09-221 TaxID=1898043 RepID=UPI000B3E48C8|nr:MarR family transcriptional regulator [Aeromicrobium sp. PE09-221]OUZ12507.1 MarR family transcriptional regulator [Aeromicrobium sp. PE09-221]
MHAEVPGARREFIERFADHWAAVGASRLEGLIAGYLLLDESDGVGALELSDELGISRGSVSTYTRQLVERGFVRRVRKPGERAHFFVMDNDVWAGFLAAEQEYLHNQRRLAETTLPLVREGGRSWERVRNMRDYMTWLIEARLPSAWEQFKKERDDPAP